MTNEEYMQMAIEQAKIGATEFDEVPIGAVIVKNGEIIAMAHNQKETRQSAIYHAEMVAIDLACKKINTWRLDGCVMYVTLEPCPMCAGALINSRIDALYYGAEDAKAGCCGTLMNIPNDERFNHRFTVVGGILKEECSRLLSNFFKEKRNVKKFKREQIFPSRIDE